MIQEIKANVDTTEQGRKLPLLQRTKEGGSTVMPETLPPVTIYAKSGPQFPIDSVFPTPPGCIDISTQSLKMYYIWLFGRVSAGDEKEQEVPGLQDLYPSLAKILLGRQPFTILIQFTNFSLIMLSSNC